MLDQKLDNIKQEKGLGVIKRCDLKMSDQCTAASKKANMMLGLILRNFNHKSRDGMKRLYSICEATPRICGAVLVIELH